MTITLLCLAGIFAIVGTVTDIMNMKVYNKHLIIFVVVGTVLHFFNYITEYSQDVRFAATNVVIGIVISYLMYKVEIWAAGDAKFFCVLVYLLPYEIYISKEKEIFPSFKILAYAFSFVFLYVIMETVLFKIAKKSEAKRCKLKLNLKDALIKAMFCVSLVSSIFFVDSVAAYVLGSLYNENTNLILMLNILIIAYAMIANISLKKAISCFLVTVIPNIIMFFGGDFRIENRSFLYFAVIAILYYIRNESRKYNYKLIDVEDISEGMVLSLGTVMLFHNSKFKGLPLFTNETTDFRITTDEATAIKQWGKSKYGTKKITIVRNIPLVPFIALGTTVFCCVNLWRLGGIIE